jgi:hypothetical protein
MSEPDNRNPQHSDVPKPVSPEQKPVVEPCNRNRWCHPCHPRTRSRKQRDTIKSRKSMLRLKWI